MTGEEEEAGFAARNLARSSGQAALATLRARGEGWPYASLVLSACDHDGSPILLLSDLAEHSINIAADPRVSLLFTGGRGAGDPLARPRVSLLGRARKSAEPRHRARFLARHDGAEGYADFGDFHFYTVEVASAHLVAGFGRIHWIEAGAYRYRGSTEELAAAEAGILAHMNAEHRDAIRAYAEKLAWAPPEEGAWRMTGIDAEGCDLKRGETYARIPFARPVATAEEARAELVRLARLAREQAESP